MPSFRATTVAACAAAALAGCIATRLSPVAPAGVHLAGDWRLDPARSEDLGQALERLRAQMRKRRRKPGAVSSGRSGPADGGRPERGEHEGRGEEAEQPQQGPAAGAAMGLGPGPQVSPIDELMSSVPQGGYLRITVGAGSFTVTSGASSNQYTPGQQSDVSAQQGYAQQISGWKGPDYLIETRPQWGAQITQTYGLTPHGRLKVTVQLHGGGIDFTLTRTYERTTRVSPLAPPTND